MGVIQEMCRQCGSTRTSGGRCDCPDSKPREVIDLKVCSSCGIAKPENRFHGEPTSMCDNCFGKFNQIGWWV